MSPEVILSAARTMLETPFRHQGRLPGVALDCAGFVAETARLLGLPVADQTDYARNPTGGLLESALDGQPCLVRVTDGPQPGDVLLMRFDGDPQHLGIYTGENLIHAWQVVGKVCEHRLDDAWRRRIVRVYRFVGVAHG